MPVSITGVKKKCIFKANTFHMDSIALIHETLIEETGRKDSG